MNIKKVYINDKETNLVVDAVNIESDELFLKVHRKADEFSEMMKKIGDPELVATEHIENQMKKIFSQECWIMHNIEFNYGYVTFALTTPYYIGFKEVASALDLDMSSDPPVVVPLMQLENSDKALQTWIYTINCRNEYFKDKMGFPETMKINHKDRTMPRVTFNE